MNGPFNIPLTAWLRWLLLSALGGFVLLSALSAFVLRDQIFQTFLDPGVPFQTYERPPAPDYTQDEAWAARPGVRLHDEAGHPAVFFIHPTTYDGGSHWNAPFDRPQEAVEVSQIILPNYAAPFLVQDVELYAPRYRQASLYTFMNNREDSVLARELAQTDIQRAFTQFLREADPEQPFFIVGVGQGGAIALDVLARRVAPDPAVARRLAAAYIIDSPTPLDLLAGPLSTIPVCADPSDIRCVVSWIAVRPQETARIEALTQRSRALDARGRLTAVEGRALLCVNPVLWTANEDYAPARLHRGAAAAEGLSLTDTPSPMTNQTGAQCQSGLLMIDQPRARALRRSGRLAEDRRVRSSNLFYMDIRANAETRLNTIRAVMADEARYAPALDAPVEVDVAPITPIDG
ncbi:DUF3089 domain-containing protein [Oceanicaulis sp.]|uniref:DUF3089 domain-containing protein n=1 Tax=Oceanicaulis sp. TaxID=1924941 RepID=UPI003BABD603